MRRNLVCGLRNLNAQSYPLENARGGHPMDKKKLLTVGFLTALIAGRATMMRLFCRQGSLWDREKQNSCCTQP
jgi:hypothetical protein